MPWPPTTHQDVQDAITAVPVIHGTDPARIRPDTTLPVIWYGTLTPNNMIDGDVYVATTAG